MNTARKSSEPAATCAGTPLAAGLFAYSLSDASVVFAVVAGPSHGSVTLGTVTAVWDDLLGMWLIEQAVVYTPAAGYYGPDSFSFVVSNDGGASAPASVEISVTRANAAPVAQDDASSTLQDTPVAIVVLANDSDDVGIASVSVPAQSVAGGILILGADNTVLYTPPSGFYGEDSFTYTIADGGGQSPCPTGPLSASATVHVTVTQLQSAPFTTFTQGGWGAPPSGNNPGALLLANFGNVYPGGAVTIGGTRTLTFTSARAIEVFLPQGGTAAALRFSATNPTGKLTVLAGQVLALRLSVDFSNAGILRGGLANLEMVSGTLAGYTVGQILALANAVLGGTPGALPAGVSIADVNSACDAINRNFDNGTTDLGYLR